MAINFQLIDKTTGEPVSLSHVDELICEDVLFVEVHPRSYGGTVFNWFDTIGYQLAMGFRLEDGDNSVRNYYRNNDLWEEELPMIEKIIDFLQEKYTVHSWVSIGK